MGQGFQTFPVFRICQVETIRRVEIWAIHQEFELFVERALEGQGLFKLPGQVICQRKVAMGVGHSR